MELLPKNIIFDENFNKQENYETINAEYRKSTKQVTVGTRWLDMFNDPNTRNQAIRKLIHEQLHYKLRNDKGHVRSIQSIYNEFEEYLDKNNVPKDAHIRAYLFKNESTQLRALEEFLVESLTSEELARYLNGIETSVPTKRGAKNLWQKILLTLSDIFGWNVTKGSLYEKELNTIRELNLSSETVEQNTEAQIDNSETNVEQEDNNNGNLQENNKTDEEKIEVQDEEAKETDESSDDFIDISDDLIDEFDSSITEQPVSQTESTYTKEEQDILSRAPRNAKGQLLAPNGKVSNLSKKQYAQVRTKAFKDWFGDWENNLDSASKVVDENGEPLVVYHNTNSKFTIFEKGHDFNKRLRSEEFTFHFGNKNTANNRTSKYSMPVFLNARNTIRGYDGMQNSPIEFINELLKQNIIDRTGFDVARNKINDIQYNYNISHKQRLERISEYIDTLLEFYGKPNSVILYSNEIEGVGEDSYMILNSNQIKSATDNTGAFSNKDDDIYHSSVTEENITLMSNVPSIASISDMLPLEQQPKFDALVASAEFETSCR